MAFEEYWDDIQDVLARQMVKNQVINSDHASTRMVERGISREDIRYVLLNNLPEELYDAYRYPHGEKPFSNYNPVFSITGRDKTGRFVTVALAIGRNRNHVNFTVVTVLLPDEKSRHRRK